MCMCLKGTTHICKNIIFWMSSCNRSKTKAGKVEKGRKCMQTLDFSCAEKTHCKNYTLFVLICKVSQLFVFSVAFLQHLFPYTIDKFSFVVLC